MNLVRRLGGRVGRRCVATALSATVVAALACNPGDKGTGPVLPPTPTPNPQITKAAFLADVNVRTGKVTIKAPEVTVNGLSAGAFTGPKGLNASVEAPDMSLVGGDVVDVTSSNFFASTVGQFQPGKVRVTFDVNLTNKLNGRANCIGPTVFPTPPAGTTGPLMFPYDITVAITSGGTSTGGQGNDVIVVLPSYGLVAPSTDWDGAPHNFFNDTGCPSGGTTPSDCFR